MKKPSNNSIPKIITVPDKSLAKPTQKVVNFDESLNEQIEKMVIALRSEAGVGLAANQLGYNNRILIAECPYEDRGLIPLTVFINPEIIEYSDETDIFDEGCLSVPPIELETERSKHLKVKYQDEKGQIHKFAPKGFLARILQHEIDHLNGILFTDRVRDKYLKDFPELKKQKIIFIGSGEFASIILKGLMMLGLNIVQVVTEKAKPAGRNKEPRPTPVFELAQVFEKNILETENINLDVKKIQSEKADLIILSDFGQILKDDILTAAKLGAINLHPSLLPKYRGATPIQTAILNGDKLTGVSLIQMVPGIDQGPLLAQIKTEIFEDENSLELEKRLAVLAVKLLFHALPRLVRNNLKPMAQNEADVIKTRKFKKEDGLIDWTKSAQEIDCQIRAFFPWPGSYTFLDDKRLIVRASHIEENKLVLDVVQPEGKLPMSFTDFLKGFKGTKPEWLNKIKI
ncbi:MAG: methionyl-tRNA formyltransferase [Candidatus Berkelbacteria bacterium]